MPSRNALAKAAEVNRGSELLIRLTQYIEGEISKQVQLLATSDNMTEVHRAQGRHEMLRRLQDTINPSRA